MVENKKLSDESLNLVSGGTVYATAQDSVFLHDLLAGVPGQCKQYEVGDLSDLGNPRRRDNIAEIKAAWAKVGVDATLVCGALYGTLFYPGDANVYKIDGDIVTREDAIKHAMKVVGPQPEGWSF